MFTDSVLRELVRVARKEEIEPASLCAVIEVESAGRLFEDDGTTPRFLFERHIFYRELTNPEKRKIAVEEGLAIPYPNPQTQYADMRNSKTRMATLALARSIDEEAANRSCSWGLAQILGANAASLGYESATSMVEKFSTGFMEQVEGFLKYIRKHSLKDELNMHKWADFARAYNGVNYRQFSYDTKMAAAYQKWAQKLDGMVLEPRPVAEIPEEIPPPYVEPKPMLKSKTLWAVVAQVFSSAAAGVGAILADWRIWGAFVVLVVFLALFIGRERILKLLDERT